MLNFESINKIVTIITLIGFIWGFLKFILKPFIKLTYNTLESILLHFYSKKILNQYSKNILNNFYNIKTPYNLQEELFVDSFDINCNFQYNLSNKLIFFFDLLKKNYPLFLIANYGMGKSTISKILFKYINENTNKYAIFINLNLKHLKKYCTEIEIDGIFYNQFSNEIFKGVIAILKQNKFINSQKIINKLKSMLVKGDIILIFDGLDEVSISSFQLDDKISLKKSELDIFIKTVFDSSFSILITCRKEYIPFATIYEQYKDKKHYKIELQEWGKYQWDIYFKNLEKYIPNKSKNITIFKNDIISNKYGDLPKRPLFLSMLTELIIFNNNQNFKIEYKLKTNLAEIYNKYIDFNLINDIKTKSQELFHSISNVEKYQYAWKKLLTELAYNEYKHSKKLSLDDIINIANEIDINEKYYTSEWIEHTLENSALFSIIHRDKNSNIFYFSHKSFMEYLIAYKLAEGFFTDKIENSYCSNAWSLYQTHEIHQHFLNEIVRTAYYNGLLNKQNNLSYEKLFNNRYIEEAFKKILNKYQERQKNDKNSLLNYYEDFEEVLYYIGKFKIKNLKSYLINILNNKSIYNSIYYRTVSLSLSLIENNTIYCDKYVLDIIDNFINKQNTNLFYENANIQKKYYGAIPDVLRNKLINNINNFIYNKKVESNISLIVFTYYTTFLPQKEELIIFQKELKKIKDVANQLNLNLFITICDTIPTIWSKMSNKPLEDE